MVVDANISIEAHPTQVTDKEVHCMEFKREEAEKSKNDTVKD